MAVLVASADLAAHDPLASAPVLAAHLVALGVPPFAVTGASFHLLPVMLRNDVRHLSWLRFALPALAGGSRRPGPRLRRRAARLDGRCVFTVGLVLVLSELLGLVRRAPRDRMLVASRTGVALVCV